MSVGVEVISRPLCKWNIYDIADFLYENGKNMNSDNWQRIADDMAMVAGDVRRLLDEALWSKRNEIDGIRRLREEVRASSDRVLRLQIDTEELKDGLTKIDKIINGTE